MKTIKIWILILFYPCLTFAQTENTDSLPPPLLNDKEANQKCYHNGKLTAKKRRNIFPFSKADSVKIISFPMSYQDVALVKDGILNKSLITEEITLSEKQINNLSDILYNYNYSKKTKLIIPSHSICGCLHIKHAILFISGNRIIAHIQIDFIDTNVETDFPDENIGVFCEGKYDLLKLLFQKVGIQQFDEKVYEEKDINIETLIEK